MHRNFFLLTLLSISLFSSGQSTNYKLIPALYELEHIKLNNKEDLGLFNNITEDKQGYLWLSSSKGIHAFDGHNLVTYSKKSKAHRIPSDPGNNISGSIFPDRQGNFWIGGEKNRLYKFITASRTVGDSVALENSLDNQQIWTAANSGEGLFFAQRQKKTNNIVLYKKTGRDPVQAIFEFEFRPDVNFFYHIVGNDHWFLQESGIIRLSLDAKKVTRYPFPGEAGSSNIVYASDTAIYFTGGKQEAIYTWNRVTDKIDLFLSIPGFISGKIHAFYVENNKLYVGSNLNFFIIDKVEHTIQNLSPQFTELARKEAPGNLSEPLFRIFRQQGDAVYLATFSNLYRLKKKMPVASQFLQQVEIDPNKPVPGLISFRALAEDQNNNIYASYYTGISKKAARKSGFISIPVSQYMTGSLVSTYSLNSWKNSLIWNNVKIDFPSGKYQFLFDSTFSGHCTQFLQHDSLWLFKWGTTILHCYDLTNNVLTSYPLAIEIPKAFPPGTIIDINDIISDESGQNLWIGSHDFGLCLVSKKGKLLKQYKQQELSTTDNYITDLERIGGKIWFGCTDGLGVLDTRTEKSILYKYPVNANGLLKNRAVFSIQPDSLGNFYLGSSYGLLYFNTQNGTFYSLPEGHPLSTPEFNRASVLRTTNNQYYFGTTDGLFSFRPGDLEFTRSSSIIRPVKLFGISIFNSQHNEYRYISENLDRLDKLVLYPFDNNIQFSFSVPEFYRDLYYSYRIKEQGENWTEFKPDNIIMLTGLQPGEYLLELKVSTGLNDDNAGYYSLRIKMKQSWYKKPWIIALFSLFILSLLVIYLRSRFNQRLKRQKDLADLRTRISSDLHDDVGTILSGLAMQSQMLAYTSNKEQRESLNEISNMSRDAMEHMRDTVWAMDSRKDKYENLIDRMRAFAEKNLGMKGITHEFIITDIDTKKFIDPEKRQAIYLIFKEAITNSINHSDGKHVRIWFGYEKNSLHLSIHDNGSKKVDSVSDGLGVSNMKMRAEKINGQLVTAYDNGFKVQLIVK